VEVIAFADPQRGLREGIRRRAHTFTQYYGSKELDASVLMIPIVGFLPPKDRRVVGTVEAIERELTVDGFVSRYDSVSSEHIDASPDARGVPRLFVWLVDDLHSSVVAATPWSCSSGCCRCAPI